MIESVQERQRGGLDFAGYYDNLCALSDICPIAAVKAHLHEGVLDINADRIRPKEWLPILESIKINRNLRFIAVRSYYQLNLDESKRSNALRNRVPVIRDKTMMTELARVLRACLSVSEHLTCLELQGLPLRLNHCKILAKGMAKNKTLTHLSLEDCSLGDDALKAITEGLRHAGNVTTLNLTNCSLTSQSAEWLSALIKFQGMCRHSVAWQESLRYRLPNLDNMPGIRRITLNHNTLFEDQGALVLAEVLKDDFWVKAVDLQACGLTTVAARAFLGGVLKVNSTLVILDLRNNPMIDRDILAGVTEQVLINGDGKDSQFKWLKLPTSEQVRRQNDIWSVGKVNSRRDGGGSQRSQAVVHGKRPSFKPAGVLNLHKLRSEPPILRQHRTRSLDRDCYSQQNTYRDSNAAPTTPKGQPWRTAARAVRYKGYPPNHTPGRAHLEEMMEDNREGNRGPMEEGGGRRSRKDSYSSDDFAFNQPMRRVSPQHRSPVKSSIPEPPPDPTKGNIVVNALLEEFQHSPPLPEEIKEMKIEIVRLRRQMKLEVEMRKEYETTMTELRKQNQFLERQLNALKGKQVRLSGSQVDEFSHHRRRGHKHETTLDENLMESIEQSFKQFHAFLDLLRDSGLGRVVSAAGMDNFTPKLPEISPAGGVTSNSSRRKKPSHGKRPRNKAAFSVENNKSNGDQPDRTTPLSPLEESRNRAQKAKTEANRIYNELKASTNAAAVVGASIENHQSFESGSIPEAGHGASPEPRAYSSDEEEQHSEAKSASPFPAPRAHSGRTSTSESKSPALGVSTSFQLQTSTSYNYDDTSPNKDRQASDNNEEDDDYTPPVTIQKNQPPPNALRIEYAEPSQQNGSESPVRSSPSFMSRASEESSSEQEIIDIGPKRNNDFLKSSKYSSYKQNTGNDIEVDDLDTDEDE